MDGPLGVGQSQPQQQQQPEQPPPAKVVERLNPAVQQQLNLESVKTRAISLFKAISRILEDFDLIARTNSVPKWQDVLGQFSMVNLELYNIVEDIKKVSKAFVVHPKNVNAENAAILPVMISSKLLPEIEADDNSKREQIDMIGAACESAEKVIADTRKTYFGTRQGPTNILTLDKAQAAKIQEQENLLRHAVNHGQGLRIPMDQRQITSALPAHLVDVLPVGDSVQTISESSGMYLKNTPPMSSNAVNNQGTLLQNQLSQLHDLQGQAQQKYQLHGQNQMQFSQSLGAQQFQGRQLPSGAIQHGIAQSQLNQGNQLTRHLNQMSSTANSALFNAAQATPNNQMFGLSGANRTLGSQNLNDQVFNMGAANPTTMLPIQQQQQQQQQQGGFGNMQQNTQNLQPGMVPMQQNPQQNHNNFQQHRQNQQ
ncbi:hypothetical protein Ccrd_005054 [Cynara cardunculus var. scolymus]|uniref:Mediator of RNA polymerase II transcription subunit 8 n=1 Tax=Cynara cardunculus var. scolymus TaxID=59895 RepID=A0A103XLS1_CYNCS|nr:hypothetical protein Ccrd_005054 [Cynara cardunculus var. scolymus]